MPRIKRQSVESMLHCGYFVIKLLRVKQITVSMEQFCCKAYATVLIHFRRSGPFHVLANASCLIEVHNIIYSLIHFAVSTPMGRVRIEIFGGPRNLPTTTVVRAADKPTSCLCLLAPRTLLLDSWSAALAATVPRNSILSRLLVRRMSLLAVRRRHLSDLHTFIHLRETSAALLRDVGSNFRRIKCETSSGRSEMISNLLGTNRPTTRNRDLKNSMLLPLLRKHD